MSEELLRIENLTKYFPIKSFFSLFGGKDTYVKAVDGISFAVRKGGTTGLVGESGSGKSTTARLITRLLKATSGKVFFDGIDVQGLPDGELRKLRRCMQMVFQDPFSSLNPRIRIGEVLATPLKLNRIVPRDRVDDRVVELLEMVGLQAEHRTRYPHEFSGGQRQRISIARAMAMEPDMIIADEAVSGLDVSVRAQVLNLFRRLQESKGLTYIFIAHDLSVVEHFCDQIVVMYGGKIVEIGPVEELFNSPLHPYTEALITAIPVPDPRLQYKPRLIKGEIVTLINRPPGCIFQSRCPIADGLCAKKEPPFEQRKRERWVACYFR